MRLCRLGDPGRERPVVLVGPDHHLDARAVTDDFDEAFFASGGIERLRDAVATGALGSPHPSVAGERIGAPIARPHQIVCAGLNYADHAAETGQAVPEEPILFTKSPNTLVGPDDDVRLPRGSEKTDWEVELGVVIGARAYDLADDDAARRAIAGYVLVNDVSERAFQLERGGQWMKGKSAPTFTPAGPWLVTPDELGDTGRLGMRLDVNGRRRQDGTTATMIFDPVFLVRYISRFLQLEPGDLLCTGTPPGVGMGMTPPTYLRDGDVMELEIDGLGAQRQTVRA